MVKALMRTPTKQSLYTIAVWVAVIGALALRLYVVWQPVPTLIAKYNADDAYYYLTIARQVALGHGVTFDGIAPTNGFHPLYLMLIVPLFWILPDQPDLIVHVAFSLLMVFNVLTAVALYRILWRTASQMAGLVAAFAWLFNPWVFLIAMEGVESSIYIFFAALTVLFYMACRMDGTRVRRGPGPAATGIVMGLTILSRSEGVLLLAALAIDMAIRRRSIWLMRDRERKLPLVVAFAITVSLVLAPWVLWNLLTFGTIVQVSGAAIYYASHVGQMTSWEAAAAVLSQSSKLVLSMTLVMVFQIYFIALPLLSILIIPRYRRGVISRIKEQSRKITSLWFLPMYALLVFGFYAWYLLHYQYWYFLAILFVASVGMGVLSDIFIASAGWRSPVSESGLTAAIISILLVLFGFSAWLWQSHNLALYPAQLDGYQVALWLAKETQPQARIGTWNSGIIGYYGSRATVNLDGVVNNSLFKYVSDRNSSLALSDIWGYILENHLDYITDYDDIFPPSVEKEFAGSLERVYEFRNTFNGQYSIRVYRVTVESEQSTSQ